MKRKKKKAKPQPRKLETKLRVERLNKQMIAMRRDVTALSNRVNAMTDGRQ